MSGRAVGILLLPVCYFLGTALYSDHLSDFLIFFGFCTSTLVLIAIGTPIAPHPSEDPALNRKDQR